MPRITESGTLNLTVDALEWKYPAGGQSGRPGEPTSLQARKPVALKLARSLDSAQFGEVMLLDDKGEVLGPRGVRRVHAVQWLKVIALGGAVFLVGAAASGPIVGSIAGGLFGSLVWWHLRHHPRYREAVALLAAGRREEAEIAIGRLRTISLPSTYQQPVRALAAKLAWQQGRLAAALEAYSELVAEYQRSKKCEKDPGYWLCLFDYIQLRAATGDVARARRLCARLDRVPKGNYFRAETILTELLLAFYSDSDGQLPEDLYDWAREALGQSRSGLTVTLLAWAFQRRGDIEMAQHLLSESTERLAGYFLEETCPQVFAWRQQAMERWALA